MKYQRLVARAGKITRNGRERVLPSDEHFELRLRERPVYVLLAGQRIIRRELDGLNASDVTIDC